jgi:hypothetical protein
MEIKDKYLGKQSAKVSIWDQKGAIDDPYGSNTTHGGEGFVERT